MPTNIKKLKASDVELAKQLFLFFQIDDGVEDPTSASNEYLKELLERDDFHIIVALENNTVIGGLTAYELPEYKQETSEMFLYEIAVEPLHRKKGIATALVEFLKKVSVERNIFEIFVGTEKDNSVARKLYLTTGGKADEETVWFDYLLD